jgi:hypothetical protein
VRCNRSTLVWLWALAVIVSCRGDDTSSSNDVLRRDSSGILIVENPERLARTALAWSIDTVPAIDIGKLQGEAPYELFLVSGVAPLNGGRILAVNAGSQELRFFSEDGRFLKAAGKKGSGPGEYQSPTLVPSSSYDTLLIHDRTRVSFVTPEGEFARSWAATKPLSEPVGAFSNTLLVTKEQTVAVGPSSPEGLMESKAIYELVDFVSGSRDTIAEVPGQVLFLANSGGNFGVTFRPFDVRPSAAVAPNRLYIAPGEVPDILVFDSVGVLRQIFRIVQPTPTLPREQFDHEVERLIGQARDQSEVPELRRRYGKMPLPSTAPVFRRVLVDAEENLWVERFRIEPDQRHLWLVMDRTGRVLGNIETPPRVTVEHVARDFLLGVMRDDADVEHVVRYRLRR